MKNSIAKLCVAASLIALVSCSSEEVIPSAYSDTFIIAKEIDGVNMYGLAFYTYANVSMSSVISESESGEDYSLSAFGGNTYEYYWETPVAGFTSEIPEIGEYAYTITATKGDVLSVSDVVSGESVDPVALTKCEFNATSNRVEVAWELSTDADYGVLILRNASGEAVYYSSKLGATTSSAYITSSNWLNGNTPTDGATYTVELNLFLVEKNDTQFLDAKATTIQSVVWGATSEG